MDERSKLLLYSDQVGHLYGTNDMAQLLYSLVAMQAPNVIVELGTGFALSTLWMALACKRKGVGHVWSIDNWEWHPKRKGLIDSISADLCAAGVGEIGTASAELFYLDLAASLGLTDHVTFHKAALSPADMPPIEGMPFKERLIDLLFADFTHGPLDSLRLLAYFLPIMSPTSSLFIHSASTLWPTYLMLEQFCHHLNSGHVPQMLKELCSSDLSQLYHDRRITLIHLTEPNRLSQNSAAWLKIEPYDLLPQPRAAMERRRP